MWDDTIDDLQLSQIADFVEAEGSLNNMSLTQTVNLYDINSTPSDFNIFSENASSLTNPRPKERFGPVSQEGDIGSLTFNGRASKTYKGGLNQRHLTAKVIHHVFTDVLLFNIYTEYIQLVSAGIDGQLNSPFYRRPLDNKNGMKLFSTRCVGVNKLSTLMKSVCAEAGITGTFTNHSGKRTCATQLYQAGIEEQEIMCRTGHRSVNSVRKYKRPSSEMMREISNVLEPPKKSNVS